MNHILLLGAFVFSAGLTVVMVKKNAIMMLLGLELMLNAANLNLVYFNRTGSHEGQMFAWFVIIVAVCEAAVGMALVLQVYRHYHTSRPEDMNELRERG